jgi:hypothetical protein
MSTEIQVFEGNGIDWQDPPEGPHMAWVIAGGYKDHCRIWVQHNTEGGGGVRFMSLNPENEIAVYLNTLFSKGNNAKTKAENFFDMFAGAWRCIGCSVYSAQRNDGWDTIQVHVEKLERI